MSRQTLHRHLTACHLKYRHLTARHPQYRHLIEHLNHPTDQE